MKISYCKMKLLKGYIMTIRQSCQSLIIIVTCLFGKLLKTSILKTLPKFGYMAIIINGVLCEPMESMKVISPGIKVIMKNFRNGPKHFLILCGILYFTGHILSCKDILESMNY